MAARVSRIIGTVDKSVTARPEYTITLFQVGLDNLEIEVDERVEAIQQVNAGLLEERQGAAIVVHYDKPLIVSESLPQEFDIFRIYIDAVDQPSLFGEPPGIATMATRQIDDCIVFESLQ